MMKGVRVWCGRVKSIDAFLFNYVSPYSYFLNTDALAQSRVYVLRVHARGSTTRLIGVIAHSRPLVNNTYLVPSSASFNRHLSRIHTIDSEPMLSPPYQSTGKINSMTSHLVHQSEGTDTSLSKTKED
jgi:hypothetical protein